MWITVNYLGAPDNGAIAITYLTSLLMAGAFLSIGAAMSSLFSSQVLAYIAGIVVAFMFTAAGWPMLLGAISGLIGPGAGELVAQFSFLTYFETAQRGVLELRALLYFCGVIALWLSLNTVWVAHKRAVA